MAKERVAEDIVEDDMACSIVTDTVDADTNIMSYLNQ